ncbi:hypothetical protein LPJ47_003649 [Vibrio parahaemolyticus]|nr:hypothetical protein [Vibrio parahaemolyticus]
MSIEDTELTATELLMNALRQLQEQPDAKINKNAVANLAGVNHTLFYKPYCKEVRLAVEKAEKKRKAELKDKKIEDELEKCQKQLEAANKKVDLLTQELDKPKPQDLKATEGAMMARLVEMYRYNDLLRSELHEKLGTDIDMESGEIIKINFAERWDD